MWSDDGKPRSNAGAPRIELFGQPRAARHSRSNDVDVSQFRDPQPDFKKQLSSFPKKVYAMLEHCHQHGKWNRIVSWEMRGTAFRVHKPQAFVKTIMPEWFNQTKIKSFQRQLNLYGFQRINRGDNKGCYHHDSFLRSQPELLDGMTRVSKSEAEDGQAVDDIFVPQWVPEASRESLEPTPISASANVMAPDPMSAFEDFFQGQVTPKYNHTEGVHPQTPPDNALKRILDRMIEPGSAENNKEYKQKTSHDEPDTGRTKRATRSSVFPDKLHDMLEYCEKNHLESIASWEMNGQAFRVRSIKKFQSQVMGKFFKLTKFESLQRQLNLYSFTRVRKGLNKGCYMHPLFQKGGRSLSKDMRRRKLAVERHPSLSPATGIPDLQTCHGVSKMSLRAPEAASAPNFILESMRRLEAARPTFNDNRIVHDISGNSSAFDHSNYNVSPNPGCISAPATCTMAHSDYSRAAVSKPSFTDSNGLVRNTPLDVPHPMLHFPRTNTDQGTLAFGFTPTAYH